jgi:ABC-type transporter Mla MlaB component
MYCPVKSCLLLIACDSDVYLRWFGRLKVGTCSLVWNGWRRTSILSRFAQLDMHLSPILHVDSACDGLLAQHSLLVEMQKEMNAFLSVFVILVRCCRIWFIAISNLELSSVYQCAAFRITHLRIVLQMTAFLHTTLPICYRAVGAIFFWHKAEQVVSIPSG